MIPLFKCKAASALIRNRILAPLALLCLIAVSPDHAQAGDVIFEDNFTHFYKDSNPWSCVDSNGQIKMIEGQQLAVDDSGSISYLASSPSVAVADLNGDGLLDLVIADARGFFWYLQNHGTKQSALFTNAEVMPIWFGDPCPDLLDQRDLVTTNVIPRIQLVDLNGEGRLDLVVGNYLGQLFCLRNQGTKAAPVFKMPSDLGDIALATRPDGAFWCNYLAPCLYDWHHNGNMDLLIGDGSYSANSIYFLQNQGNNQQPAFNKSPINKVIPGMGREHLVPHVISWNGDGKADILATERQGFIDIFLNQPNAVDSDVPAFDEGHHVLIGGQEQWGIMPTVTPADLDGTGLPGLVIATADGRISFSANNGTAKNYQFGTPVPLKLTNSKPPVLIPYGWTLDGGYGSPYDLLVCTNSQVQPDFSPPDNTNLTTALRFFRDEPAHPNPTFPGHFYPEEDTRMISREGSFSLKADNRYNLSFWIKTDDDITDIKYLITGYQSDPNNPGASLGRVTITDSVTASNSWEQFTAPIRFESLSDDSHAAVDFDFHILFNGKGALYLAAVKIQEED